MFIETETTPNPATLKFLPGQEVMYAGTRDFRDEVDAEASPLASALFDLGDVTGVLFGRDFVAVTAAPGSDWSALKPQVVAILLDHFITEAPLFHAPTANGIMVPAEDEDYGDDPAHADVIAQIKELIETMFARRLPTMAAISSIAGSRTGSSPWPCRGPVRAAQAPPPRSRTGSSRC